MAAPTEVAGGLAIAAVLALASARAPAQNERATPAPESASSLGEAGTGSVAFRLSYYHNDDAVGEGNPFLDERLTVIEPVLYFDYNVTERTQVWGRLCYDNVSSASIARLSKFPNASGASGDEYKGLELGLQRQWSSDTRVGGFVSGSAEFDYTSHGVGGFWQRQFDEGNASLKGSLNAFFDRVDIIRFDHARAGKDDRLSLTAQAIWYQIVDPSTHGELGLSLTHQEGFLETPYNAVVIENPADPPNPDLHNNARGTEVTEELPSSRLRAALFGRIRTAAGDGLALELGGRLYRDDWGINGLTLEPHALFWLFDDVVRADASYRFYVQSEADAYRASFTTLERFRTQDSDLGSFDAHTLGLQLTWYTLPSVTVDIGVQYTIRSDDLDFIFLTTGFSSRF